MLSLCILGGVSLLTPWVPLANDPDLANQYILSPLPQIGSGMVTWQVKPMRFTFKNTECKVSLSAEITERIELKSRGTRDYRVEKVSLKIANREENRAQRWEGTVVMTVRTPRSSHAWSYTSFDFLITWISYTLFWGFGFVKPVWVRTLSIVTEKKRFVLHSSGVIFLTALFLIMVGSSTVLLVPLLWRTTVLISAGHHLRFPGKVYPLGWFFLHTVSRSRENEGRTGLTRHPTLPWTVLIYASCPSKIANSTPFHSR